MDQLIQEVDDALRADRMQNFWRKSGRYVIIASVMIVGLTAGYVAWRSHHEQQQEKWTDILIKAQENIDSEDPESAVELLARTSPAMEGTLQTMASLWLSQLYLQQGELEKAASVSQDIAKLETNGAYSDYNSILATPDTHGTIQATSPFYGLLQEKNALALLQSGNTGEAITALKTLEKDATTSATVHARINLILLQLEAATPTPVQTVATQPKATKPTSHSAKP
jgi:hypothetical protein